MAGHKQRDGEQRKQQLATGKLKLGNDIRAHGIEQQRNQRRDARRQQRVEKVGGEAVLLENFNEGIQREVGGQRQR